MKARRINRHAATLLAGAAAVLASALMATSAQAVTVHPGPAAHSTSASAKPGPAALRAAETKFEQLRSTGRTVGAPHQLTKAQMRAEGLGKYVRTTGGCWYLPFYDTNTAILWFGTSETWCGSGSTITYAAMGNCFGGTRYPTYNYFGCSHSAFYGAGWNIAQQEVTWQICIAWLPWPASTCLDQESPTDTLTFYPNGNYSVWYH